MFRLQLFDSVLLYTTRQSLIMNRKNLPSKRVVSDCIPEFDQYEVRYSGNMILIRYI